MLLLRLAKKKKCLLAPLGLGYMDKGVKFTMIYTHVLNGGGKGYEVRWTCSKKPYGNASYADCIRRRSFKGIYAYGA